MGYVPFHRKEGGYRWLNPESGEREAIDILFFNKQLARQGS